MNGYLHPNPTHAFPDWHPNRGKPGSPRMFVASTNRHLRRQIPDQRWKRIQNSETFENELDLTSKLGEISKPTLILAGKDDVATPVAQSEEMRDKIPGAQLTVVEDAGHWLPIEKPQEACDAVNAFFS
jgi:pimeloyl-ACP methyl ester carboxylesterase